MNIAINGIIASILDGALETPSLYSPEVAGDNIKYLYLEAFGFFFLVVLIEYCKTRPWVSRFFRRLKENVEDVTLEDMDEDVKKEEDRVLQQADDESNLDVLRLLNLRKVYGNGKVAVRNVTLGIPEGECFGYLGINGAGKTTTMKCLTGDVFPTKGTGYINGFNIVSQQTDVRQHIGYCSQFSSILGLLSVREHLELFAEIKQVQDVEDTVQKLLKRLSLTPFEKKLSKSLSGGNKRKLSVAIAMIGSPSVVLLDEPSTGMDVASRRFMWDVIENMTKGKYDGKKTSVVLTTHSMEECEALCSRLGIMVGGRLRCLGSPQHLKTRFGTGYTIETKLNFVTTEEVTSRLTGKVLSEELFGHEIEVVCHDLSDDSRFKKLKDNSDGSSWTIFQRLQLNGKISTEFLTEWILQQERKENLVDFLSERFEGLELSEAHDYKLVFRVAKTQDTKLSTVFSALENNKENLMISEYSVSQTTLEQIFNSFAAQQEEETGIARGMLQAEADTTSDAEIDELFNIRESL